MKIQKTFLIWALLFISSFTYAQQGLEMDLWSSAPKTSNGDPNDLAKVTVFLPSKNVATGRAVVICPGGGYQHLAFEKEGTSWAPFFNAQGIAVIVLKYRMPHGVWQVPLEDAEEAMRLVRRMSVAWDINPKEVGIMGFSAGGHLASTVATHSSGDAAPDFQILFYPVITMEQGITHKGSRENLLGKKPKRKLMNQFCNEQHVSGSTPRAFIVLAHDDKAVSPLNSISYYEELCLHKVPATMHIYPSGGHGFGSLQSFLYHYEMMLELKAWLRSF
ncbi:MAG: alpha/beta hydrolase [Prevotella sp.]|jgi:acetyl esterase/lipase|uniref:alpha/beta hydrolase n=1 Tax=Prevotella sp. tf2-5 TaxID=1761889 RepID=UPI0008EB1B6D|nr:alpha/beta hydrolase [Prevotella sp. tf2-5]MBR2243987.1 alpha/beta hydrolase [Prevotella sp.]SFO69938.1 Acetyl esterase/lipase [Prevotella sp. tf2-5]